MRKIVIGFFSIVTLLAVSWALLTTGFFRIHDYTHAARIAEMLRGLQEGQFPVRWSQNFGFGYGMPLFEFYAPLPYFVGAALYWSGLDIITSIKLLFVICSSVTFFGMYFLARRWYGWLGGLVSAVAITVAPYRAVNLYVRGALSEAWGIMAMPWILLGIVQVLRKERQGWITLVVSLVVLFLSHNLMTLLFVPVTGLFALAYWWQVRDRNVKFVESLRPLFALALSYLLAIGVCAFYLFPALIENNLTKVSGVFQGYFFYGNHFLYIRQFFIPNWGYHGSVPGPDDGLSFFLGYGQVLAAVLALLFLLIQTWRKRRVLKTSRWLKQQWFLFGVPAVLLGIALFMTLYKAQFIWDAIPTLRVVQFPWRWLSVAVTFLALLCGQAVALVHRKFLKGLVAVGLLMVMIVGNANYFRPEFYLEDPVAFYYTDSGLIRSSMSKVLNDYIPQQMQLNTDAELPVTTELILKKDQLVPTPVIEVDRMHEKLIKMNSATDQTLELGVADFPGWIAYLDGLVVPTGRAPLGNITVSVPAGNHTIGLRLNDSPVRALSDLVSAISTGVLLLLLFQLRRHHD